jgi:sporulation protein YlmC with PRC-barrel domain
MKKTSWLAVLTLVAAGTSAALAADSPYTIVKSADLIGKQVKNSGGTVLGKVEDFVVNIKDGSMVYGVVQYGDTVGFGGKLFAVPPQALSLANDQKAVIFEAQKEDLEKAAGFDANKWPTEADKNFAKKGGTTDPKKDEPKKDEPKKDDKKDEPKKDDSRKDDDAAAHLRRVSSLKGTAVKNMKGEDLGSIYDIVFNMKDGKIHYAAMSYGGVAGIGSKYFAIPWDAMSFQSPTLKAGERAFLIDSTKEELDKLTGFDKTWPTEPDNRFSKGGKKEPVKP